MSPEFLMQLVRDYPLTTPAFHLTGFPTIDDFWGRTLNAWPDIKQLFQIFG